MLHDQRLLLRASTVESSEPAHPRPGEIVSVAADGLVVGTGAGLLGYSKCRRKAALRRACAIF